MSKFLWRSPNPAEPQLDVAAVYQQNGRLLWATLHRLGVAESDLPDVMQEVLVVIHRRLPSYDRAGRLQAWLFGICTKVVANYRRRSFRRHEHSMPDLDSFEAHDSEALHSMRDERAALHAVLERIDPPKRAVLLMFEIEGLSCQQIADELGIPLGTVHSRLHGARQDFVAASQRISRSYGIASTAPIWRFGT